MISSSETVPAEVLERFGLAGSGVTVERLGRGHIHRTYLARGEAAALVLQRINAVAFPDPKRLALNAGRVTSALERARARGDYSLEWPTPVIDDRGNDLVSAAGETWRAMSHIGGTYVVQEVDTPDRARRGAQAFGEFCAALEPLDPGEIDELIPDFHDLDHRLDRLHRVVRSDPSGRVSGATVEIESCCGQQSLVDALRAVQQALPRRVCHNDTKINNLLFDEKDHVPRAVVDLDTCMPGWWMHDFGDIVRTFCSPEPEDSTRLGRVRVRDDVFAAVCEGFITPLGRYLSADERESLWLGARGICLVIAVRFLTDHLEGDPYFGAAHDGHNLDRARNQLALYRDLTARENELRPLVLG